jgi:hypothetical protein
MKSDEAVATSGIITFGTEAQPVIDAMDKETQNALFQKTAEQIAERLGTDLTGLVIHRDESAIHAHFQLVAVARDGTPLSKVINRDTAKEMQDIAGRVFNDHGITRGTPKAERIARGEDASKTVHRSVKTLHKDLPKEIEELELRIEVSERRLMKNKNYIEQQVARLNDGHAEEEKVRKRLEAYEQRAESARKELEDLVAQKRAARSYAADVMRVSDAILDGVQNLFPNPEIGIKQLRYDLANGLKKETVEAAIAFREKASDVRHKIEAKGQSELLKEPQLAIVKVREEQKKSRGMEL